jgi:adenylate cyclase class IV
MSQNIETKAKISDIDKILNILTGLGAIFKSELQQEDPYRWS